MKNKTRSLIYQLLFLLLVLNGCASTQTTSSTTQQDTTKSRDAHTDASLGALPTKQKAEAEKEAEELLLHDEASDALGEFRKKELQEELQRTQRSIVEFDKSEEQLRGQQ